MSTYHMTMEAMSRFQPEKAQLIHEIFSDLIISGISKPTYNLTTHELSCGITHVNSSSWDSNISDYVYERNHIVYSCENKVYINPDPTRVHAGFYIFVEDLDISVLKAIKYEIGNTPYWDWLDNKHAQEKKIKTELADLKAKLNTISAVFNK